MGSAQIAAAQCQLLAVLLVFGSVDLGAGALLFVYPRVLQLPTLNYYAERFAAAGLLASGAANFHAVWRYTQRSQFVDLLWIKVFWSLAVLLGFLVSSVQFSGSLPVLLFMSGFAADLGIYSGFLLNYRC